MEEQLYSSRLTSTSNLNILLASKDAAMRDTVPSLSSKETVKDFKLQECVMIRKEIAADAAMFLLKIAALDTVRRFSRAKCPFIWNGIQAMQLIHCPPFKWMQKWAVFKQLGRGMQILSRPLLLLSAASAFDDISHDPTDPTEGEEEESVSSALQSSESTRISDDASQPQSSENWLLNLCQELNKEGIVVPERINEKDLYRFYTAANGDFSRLFSSVKKTIHWRETYNLLTEEELEKWSKLVFWHGCDMKYQPCLIVRLGLACSSLSNQERPRFAQAIVSQVDHGILHLADERNPQISVLVDCEGLSPLKVPVRMMKSCSLLLQEHYPNCLCCLFVIRLPPALRMIAQTCIHVLNPITRQKLNFLTEPYQETLSELLQAMPTYLGGNCLCTMCSEANDMQDPHSAELIHEIRHFAGISNGEEDMPPLETDPGINLNMFPDSEQTIRSGIIAFLMFWSFIALIAGMYDS